MKQASIGPNEGIGIVIALHKCRLGARVGTATVRLAFHMHQGEILSEKIHDSVAERLLDLYKEVSQVPVDSTCIDRSCCWEPSAKSCLAETFAFAHLQMLQHFDERC